MRPSYFTVLVLALFLLVACGGGDSEPNQIQGPIIYTALGDSLAAGVGGSPGYVERYADHLRSDLRVEVRPVFNLGVPGFTSSDLLVLVQSESSVRASISSARVLVWDIGGNDLREARSRYLAGTCGGNDNLDCFRVTVATVKSNWDALLREFVALKPASSRILRTMDIYNPYVGEDTPSEAAAMKPFLDEVNAYIHATAASNGVLVARVYQAFNGADGTQDPVARGLISADGLHPNNNGYVVIADELRKLGYSPLQ